MGLFGGFKAKFTRTSKEKTNTNGVVCLKYHIMSEFQSQNNIAPVPNLCRNESARKHSNARRLIRSQIFSKRNSPKPILCSNKAQSLTNLKEAVNNSEHFYDVSNPDYEENEYEHIENSTRIVTNNYYISAGPLAPPRPNMTTFQTENIATESEKEQTTYNKSSLSSSENKEKLNGLLSNLKEPIHKEDSTPKPLPRKVEDSTKNKNQFFEKSTLINMTQKNDISNSLYKNEENGETNFDKPYSNGSNFPSTIISKDNHSSSMNGEKTKVNNQEDKQFEINVVNYDKNNMTSSSEDEISIHGEEQPDFEEMGYSSQAASIFFGGDQESEVPRPRKIKINSKEDTEADC